MHMIEILKSIRKELNISQETLARELNVSFATINRWENNRAKPSRLAIIQIKEFAAKQNIPKEIMIGLERIKTNTKF